MEARVYLDPAQEKNGLWKTSREQTLGWVDELYEAGAAEVHAVYSPGDDTVPFNMCASLLVELPADKAKRTATLRTFNAIEADLWGEDAEPLTDDGQAFLFLNMDP